MTWVASVMFNPLEPEWSGRSRMLTVELVLNSERFLCRECICYSESGGMNIHGTLPMLQLIWRHEP